MTNPHLARLRALSPLVLPEAEWGRVCAAYTEPQRRYHTLEHLVEMAERWHEVDQGPGWADREASWLALLYHDIVYAVDAAHGENERQSATALLDAHPGGEAAAALVRLTASHGAGAPAEGDAALFLDCDLAILAASPERFAAYERQVEAEYTQVIPAGAYAIGRAAFLARMRASTRLFLSPYFYERLEARARENLARAG